MCSEPSDSTSTTPAPAPELVVIANPASGRGRGRLVRRALRGALARRAGAVRPEVDVLVTTAPGEERTLALDATRAGAGTILALGGDGTWGNVARGILAGGGTTRLALLASGTGNDLAFATGLAVRDAGVAIGIARGAGERRIDVGEVDGVHFLNCVGFGFDAEVVRETHRTRWLRGHAVYLMTAARLLFGYRGFEARVAWDEEWTGASPSPRSPPVAMGRHLALIVANGARIGGGFLIAPEATVDDGALDVVRVADVSPWRRAVIFSGAPRGTHLRAPEVMLRRSRALTLTFAAPPVFEAAGELYQAQGATVEVRCLAGALRLTVSMM
jgi:diacylglycerol kinase (ATP)